MKRFNFFDHSIDLDKRKETHIKIQEGLKRAINTFNGIANILKKSINEAPSMFNPNKQPLQKKTLQQEHEEMISRIESSHKDTIDTVKISHFDTLDMIRCSQLETKKRLESSQEETKKRLDNHFFNGKYPERSTDNQSNLRLAK